jgi:hypothetical protein
MNEGWVSDDRDGVASPVGVLWWPACLYRCGCGHSLFSLEDVQSGQWMGSMNDLQVLIEQMTVDISVGVAHLDDHRLRLFLGWLDSHSSEVKFAGESSELVGKQVLLDVAMDREANMEEHLKLNLKRWFESLPMQRLLWEYRLILGEITWWRDLDARRLLMILRSEEKK